MRYDAPESSPSLCYFYTPTATKVFRPSALAMRLFPSALIPIVWGWRFETDDFSAYGRPAARPCQSVRRVRAKATREGHDGEASEGDRRLKQDDEVRHRDGRAHLQAPPVGEVRTREEEVHGCVRGAPRIPKPLSRSRDRTHRRRVQPFPFPPRAQPLHFVSCADPSTSPMQRTTSTTRAASGTKSRWCTVAP